MVIRYSTKKTEIGIADVLDAGLFMSICSYILYTFWYQYAVGAIPGFLNVAGVIILFFSFLSLKRLSYYSNLLLVIGFVLYSLLIGLVFKSETYDAVNEAITLIKYLIPFFGIYTYLNGKTERVKQVLYCIVLAGVLLSTAFFTKGELNTSDILTMGDMNNNLISNILTFGFVAALMLVDVSKGRHITKNAILTVSCIVMGVAQINSASRRGFLIMIFLVIAYILVFLNIKYERRSTRKMLAVLAVLLIAVVAAWQFGDALLETTLFNRLEGENTGGDIRRQYLQGVAWNLFLENPLTGNGLKCVSQHAGMYSHSLYYELLACTGIIGFVMMLSVILGAGEQAYKLASKRSNLQKEDRMFMTVSLIFIISILASGFVMVYFYESYFYIMLALIIGSIQAIKQKYTAGDKNAFSPKMGE